MSEFLECWSGEGFGVEVGDVVRGSAVVESDLRRGDKGFDVVVSDVDVSGAVKGAGVVGGKLDGGEVVGECSWRENLDGGWENGAEYVVNVHDLLGTVG